MILPAKVFWISMVLTSASFFAGVLYEDKKQVKETASLICAGLFVVGIFSLIWWICS